jgi:hypothetical protein
LSGGINKASDDRTVAEYQEKFLPILGHIEALSMAQQVSIFTASLIDLLKIDVELYNPQDLEMAMILAHAHEPRAKIAATGSTEASSSENSSMPIGQLQCIYALDGFNSSWGWTGTLSTGKSIVFSITTNNAQEAIAVNSFSTLK